MPANSRDMLWRQPLDRHRKGKVVRTEGEQIFEDYLLLHTKERTANGWQGDKEKAGEEGQELSRATNNKSA